MNNEFKKILSNKEQTVYVLESATSGGTSAGSVATVSKPLSGVRKRGQNLIAQEGDKDKVDANKPRNFVAKNAKMGGAGAHKDKKKAAKQGDVKHKKPFAEAFQNDEANLYYRYDTSDGRLKQRMVHNNDERQAFAQGFKDTPKLALKAAGIIRSKFDPKKFVQNQGGKWVQVFPYGDEQGVAEGRVDQLPTHGADYSEYDTDHLKMMLRPGILHRNEARFKALIRQELKKREQQSQQGVAEGLMGSHFVRRGDPEAYLEKMRKIHKTLVKGGYKPGGYASSRALSEPFGSAHYIHSTNPDTHPDVFVDRVGNQGHIQVSMKKSKPVNLPEQGVAEGSLNEGQYEMMMRNGQVKKFIAKDDADAKRIAAGYGAKSVIKLRGGVPAGKVAEQGVAETFDNPYKAKWEKSEYGDQDALVNLPDGTNLSIMFSHEDNNEWQVEFHRNNSQEVTGDGDAQRIFATVLNAMQKFIKKQKPARLTFAASKVMDPTTYYEPDEPQPNPASRAKLYDRLVQRYAKAWGYRAFRADNGHVVMYELSRIKKAPASESAGSGVIASKKQANDPRYSMSLTKDVRPGQIAKKKKQGVEEEWSKKYKSSINCSHPKGFSQKAHCAGKKKHTESMMTMETTCPDCGMCQTHGNLNEIAKGAKDSNGFTKCWPGHHAAGTKKGKNGGQVRNCVPNEGYGDHPSQRVDPRTGKRYVPPKSPLGQGVAEDHSTASGGWGQGAYASASASSNWSGPGQDDSVQENPDWYNDEANGMTTSQLKSLIKHAAKLRHSVKAMQAQGDTLEPWQQAKVTKAADYLDAVFTAVDDDHDMGEDSYMSELQAKLNEKISKNAPVDVWIKDFEKSNAPQFRGKTQEKRRQMAIAASYGAKTPSKKR